MYSQDVLQRALQERQGGAPQQMGGQEGMLPPEILQMLAGQGQQGVTPIGSPQQLGGSQMGGQQMDPMQLIMMLMQQGQ